VCKDRSVPGWSHTNLKELDDAAVGYGLSPNLEARFARKALGGERSGLSYQRLAPNFHAPTGHRHAAQEEWYVVVSGGGRAKIADEVRELRALDVLRVAPETPRAFEAGPDGLELIAFGAGEPGDAEMLPEFWPAD
jgi:mannose-6-phosphate isomerase-like protein (cupin superfamily)